MVDEFREPMDRLFSDVDHLGELMKDFQSDYIESDLFVSTTDVVSVLARDSKTKNPQYAAREFAERFEEKRGEFKRSLLELRGAEDGAARSGGAIRSLTALSLVNAEVQVFEGSVRGFHKQLRKYSQSLAKQGGSRESDADERGVSPSFSFQNMGTEAARGISSRQFSKALTPLSGWTSGVVDWLRDHLLPEIRRVATALWALISRFLNPKEWAISGGLSIGLPGFVQGSVSLQVTFGI